MIPWLGTVTSEPVKWIILWEKLVCAHYWAMALKNCSSVIHRAGKSKNQWNYELISAIERKFTENKKLCVRFAHYRFIPHLSTNFRHRMHAVGLWGYQNKQIRVFFPWTLTCTLVLNVPICTVRNRVFICSLYCSSSSAKEKKSPSLK